MSNGKESPPLPTAFTGEFAVDYDNWSGVGRHYEALSRVLAKRLLETKPDAKHVLEIGSGTGNSATVFLEQAPQTTVFGVEPGDFINLASAKRKSESAVSNFFASFGFPVPPYSEEIARRLQPHQDRLYLFREGGEALSFVNESVDGIFMCQVFHWFKDNQDTALEEMRRVLKPGGVVVFDESGAQFDFGSTKEGEDLNGKFIHHHPFARLFRSNLDEELHMNGHQPISSVFKYQFTYDSLKQLYESHGFELIDTPDGALYDVTVRPDSLEKIVIHEKTARMRIMASAQGGLLKDSVYVDRMIERVMDKTKQIWDAGNYDDGKEYGATAATFVARKGMF